MHHLLVTAEHFSTKEVAMNVVYVLAPDGTPLMPCSCIKALDNLSFK
jgi:hypothetical protein